MGSSTWRKGNARRARQVPTGARLLGACLRFEHAVEMKQLVPNAQLAILPGTKHMQVIRPDLVLPMVTAFLRQ